MQVIESSLAPSAIGNYSQAIKVGDTVYLSGQIPLNPQTMQLCSDDIKSQIRQVFNNLQLVCQAAGGSLAQLVKLNVYLIDLTHFVSVNEVMLEYFTMPYPARAVVGVAALPRSAKIEMDGVMVLS